MRHKEFGHYLAVLVLASLPSLASAAVAIDDVVNAASRIPSGFPSYGVAQGALFAIKGSGLGPDSLQQASFPLPAGDGLSGVSVQVAVGGNAVAAIMVYVSATEVGAILPSSTPLGTGTVTVNNNGDVATSPITVVASAFGAFSLDYFSGGQYAAAFIAAADGSAVPASLGPVGQSAQPGQTVTLNGTGLGAISSDETQNGSTDVPNVQLKVWVGNQPAAVISAGRGPWTGLPSGLPVFPVPQTIAAWDVIQFAVPAGVTGCRVPVVVQTGNFVSNFVWISVSADGGPCVDLNTADFGDTVTFSGTVKTGYINLLRTTLRSTMNGFTTGIGNEIGTAIFTQYDVPGPVTVRVSEAAFATLSNNLDPGTCLVQTFRAVIPANPAPITTPPPPVPANRPMPLDAGAAILLKNQAGASQQLKQAKDLSYSGGIGSSFSFPGLPEDTSQLFLNPGTITANNGSGGAGVPAFTASITLPKALTFDNIDALGPSVDRSKGVTVKWSGGDPNSYVNIVGGSYNISGNVTLIGSFSCSERISAGQFTIPPFVTLNLPVTAGKAPQPPIGTLSLWNYVLSKIQIPGLDLALFSVVLETQTGILYQ